MELTKGANVALNHDGGGGVAALILGLTWDAGSLECDVCALICGVERKVVDDQHFLFWNNTCSPDRTVFLRSQPETHDPSKDRAQILIDLSGIPTTSESIVIILSTLAEGASLRAVKSLRLRAVEPSTGNEIASYKMDQELTIETCLIVAEVYRHRGYWKVRAVGQGYQTGLTGLGRDFGVNLTA